MTKEFKDLPQSSTCKLIEFSKVEVRPGIVKDTYILVVTGSKPFMNMDVKLVPVVYITQPDYWNIEVVGCLSGYGLPAIDSFAVSIALDGIRGTKGINLIGASGSKQVDIP